MVLMLDGISECEALVWSELGNKTFVYIESITHILEHDNLLFTYFKRPYILEIESFLTVASISKENRKWTIFGQYSRMYLK